MRRLLCSPLLRSITLVAFVNICFTSAHAAPRAHSRHQNAPGFEAWMAGTPYLHSSFVPSSPDNWLGGTGNWSNGADWSAGEPGGSSDVFINTGNDNVTLDVNASINSLTLGGTSGSSMLTSNGNTLTIAGSLTINHTGTLTFSNGGASVDGNAQNAGTIHLLQGSGLSARNFTNSGGIMMASSAGVAVSGMLINSGSIQSEDMISGVSGGTVMNSGLIVAFVVSSGGDFTNQGSVITQHLNVGGNLTNAGLIQGTTPGSGLDVAGELTNSGTFDTEYGGGGVGSLNNLTGGEIYDVSGTLQVNGNANNAGRILVGAFGAGSPSGLLSIEGRLTNSGYFGVAAVTDGPATASVSGNVVNRGTISVTGGGEFGAGGSITNSGMISTGQQSGFMGNNSFAAGTLSNQAGGVLALESMGDTANFGSVTNAGTISIANGATLTVPPSSHATGNALSGFLNSGTVQIASGGTLSSLNKYTQTAGQTTIDGTLRGPTNFAGGAVYGNGGTINGNVTSNAAFNMGDMPMTVGTMAINGNYTQGANGSLAFDIASLTSYDQLNVSGHAALNGTLFVDLLNGYIPQIGNMFDIMNFSGSSGTFSMVLGLPINNNEHFVLEYNPTNLTLDVVAGPDNLPTSGHANAFYYEPYISDVMQGSSPIDNFSSAPASSVPEPGSIVLLCSGIVGVAASRRKIR